MTRLKEALWILAAGIGVAAIIYAAYRLRAMDAPPAAQVAAYCTRTLHLAKTSADTLNVVLSVPACLAVAAIP